MPNTQKFELTAPQISYLKLLEVIGTKVQAIVPNARRAFYDVLETDLDCAPSFGALYALEELSAELHSAYDETVRQYAEGAGFTRGDGSICLNVVDGRTFAILEDAPAADPLAEVAELSGPALFAHPQFPAYVDLAREKFTEVVNDFVAEHPDTASPREIADTKRFITDFCDSAISATKPIETAQAVGAK